MTRVASMSITSPGRPDPPHTHRRQRPAGLAAQQPGPFPRHRPGLLHARQHRRRRPRPAPASRRRRGHRPEQARLVPQHRQIGDRLPAVGEHHRHIGQHPTRRMRRTTHPAARRPPRRTPPPDPVAAATSASSRAPTCDTTPRPSADTTTLGNDPRYAAPQKCLPVDRT